jgi:succinate CoA transferase
MTAEEAAAMIHNGDAIGFGGFTAAGAPKAISRAIAVNAEKAHSEGKPFQIRVFTGASTGDSLDGVLARANAISFRTPYQSNGDLRKRINSGDTAYVDMHLSVTPQNVRYGFFGKIDYAIIEAADVTADGEITLTAGVGAAPTYARLASKIFIELNKKTPKAIRGLHDIYEPLDPPNRREIPVYSPSDRIGSSVMKVDPSKIVGIVETDLDDEIHGFDAPSDETTTIGNLVAEFLVNELRSGRIPKSFLPLQSGVGNIANAILGALGRNEEVPPFSMYTEVLQDAVVDLIKAGRVKNASTCSLTISPSKLQEIYADLDFYKQHIVLRPQEVSNNPEVVRRLGIVSINTAIEADIFGNVNSTHIMGKRMMNGIGGSGDFTRGAYISIFTCVSTTKKGMISTIVPQVSHADHSEHSVQVVVTEQGVADLRGLDPHQRAEKIIEVCAHPDYKPALRQYLHLVKDGHTPQSLSEAFSFHRKFLETGDMHGVTFAAPEAK